MGNAASHDRVNSNVPGYINDIHSTSDQDMTPVPVIEPVPGDRPFARVIIPSADENVLLFNPTDRLPTPARTTAQAFRPVFLETPSDYMTTEFLKRCFTCKREFGERVEIFMYKDLSFCSDDCRNKEMDKDAKEETKNHDKITDNSRSDNTEEDYLRHR